MSERILPGIKFNKITVYRGGEKFSIDGAGEPVDISVKHLKSMGTGADIIIVDHRGDRSIIDFRE